MIFLGSDPFMMVSGPFGRQFVPGLSRPRFAKERLTFSTAQGRTSVGLRSAAIFMRYLPALMPQTPDKSGFPSEVRGAGAFRFGLPSGVRGMPGVGYLIHCAGAGVETRPTKTATAAPRKQTCRIVPPR